MAGAGDAFDEVLFPNGAPTSEDDLARLVRGL